MDWIFVSIFCIGLAAALSPCPLAANIAAVGFISQGIGTRSRVMASSAFYTLGRVLAYLCIGLLLSRGLASAPALSFWVQEELPVYMGPIMMITGLVILDCIPFFAFGKKPGAKTAMRLVERGGMWGSLLLGFLFALAMCPPSAALFFGSAVPLSMQIGGEGAWCGIALFGLGTSLPVVVFSLLVSFSARKAAVMVGLLPGIQRILKVATGGLFLILGGYWVCSRILFV